MASVQGANGPQMPSYGAGFAFVQTRTAGGVSDVSGPLEECQQYVESGSNRLDGFPSDSDFLNGCRAATSANIRKTRL